HRAHLSQAAGAADLVRSGADGVRRLAVAVRPAAAGRRAETGQGAARPTGGGVGDEAAHPRHDVRDRDRRVATSRGVARRGDVRSGPGGAGAGAVAGTALHGLPEPVDRRFRSTAGARSAASGARTHRLRRQRRAGDRFPGGALWRVRAAEAALRAPDIPALARSAARAVRRWTDTVAAGAAAENGT